MNLPIILIGPMHAGKSTIAEILSRKLGIPETPVDYVAGYYYVKNGVNLHELAQVMKTGTVIDYVEFMKEDELKAALETCDDFPDSIISFGAGHAYYTEQNHVEQLLTLRDMTPNIFLILPSQDAGRSDEILSKRIEENRPNDSVEKKAARKEMNRKFIESESMRQLAYHTILTEGKTADQAADEIISLLK